MRKAEPVRLTYHDRPNAEFLVDQDRHRIVKRAKWWRMYCPKRGTQDIIVAPTFDQMLDLARCRCPHLSRDMQPLR